MVFMVVIRIYMYKQMQPAHAPLAHIRGSRSQHKIKDKVAEAGSTSFHPAMNLAYSHLRLHVSACNGIHVCVSIHVNETDMYMYMHGIHDCMQTPIVVIVRAHV